MRPSIEDLVDLHVWGRPLVLMRRTLRDVAGGHERWTRRDRLTTPADRGVVAPNNDTLYASAWFDLDDAELRIDVDPLPAGRYWSVMVLDAATNVQYLCRRLHGPGPVSAVVRRAGRPPTDATDVDVELVVPSATVWVLARVLVEGPEDLDAARAALDLIRARRVGAAPRSIPPPPDGSRGARSFADLVDALRADPPWTPRTGIDPPLPLALDALLGGEVDADDLDEAARVGRQRIAAHGSGADALGNGWGTRRRGADFGGDALYRAAFAEVSLAGHLPAENRSYNQVVDGSRPMELRFPPGGTPPVTGFWSLVVYGPDLQLVSNPADRWSIGDRSPDLRVDLDGTTTIRLGPEQPADPRGWLPTPAGPCVLVLRAYEGAPEVVDATWFPPPVVPL